MMVGAVHQRYPRAVVAEMSAESQTAKTGAEHDHM
jgi:hypothetical protein